MYWENKLFKPVVSDTSVCFVFEEKIGAIVISIATKHVLHIEYFEGDTSCSNNDGE
jgi:hypothetical protein